jgi:hypothetical protein
MEERAQSEHSKAIDGSNVTQYCGRRTNSGSLTMLAAMRRASSLVNRLVAHAIEVGAFLRGSQG